MKTTKIKEGLEKIRISCDCGVNLQAFVSNDRMDRVIVGRQKRSSKNILICPDCKAEYKIEV